MIRVDIHTKRISAETRIYVTRPGGQYRFFDRFVDNDFVGPDLPGLELPAFRDVNEIEDLEDRVKRSVAIRRYALRGQRDVDVPERDLESYKDKPGGPAISQFVRVARAYFGQLKQNDIVIVPPINFRGMAQIGELTGQPNQVRSLETPAYLGDPLTGRNVRWLASMPKSAFPAQTLDALQKPNPLFLLPKDAWAGIFRRAYGSYVTDTEYGSRFEITSDRYQTTDDFLIQAFFNFVAANTDRVLAGREDMLSLRDGAFSTEGAAPDLFTNVNSPGGLSLKSAIITPIVIATMFTLAITVGVEAYAAAEQNTIVFGNSQAPAGDACTAGVDAQVVTQITLLGYDRWAEACAAARRAAANTGISTTVEIRN